MHLCKLEYLKKNNSYLNGNGTLNIIITHGLEYLKKNKSYLNPTIAKDINIDDDVRLFKKEQELFKHICLVYGSGFCICWNI